MGQKKRKRKKTRTNSDIVRKRCEVANEILQKGKARTIQAACRRAGVNPQNYSRWKKAHGMTSAPAAASAALGKLSSKRSLEAALEAIDAEISALQTARDSVAKLL